MCAYVWDGEHKSSGCSGRMREKFRLGEERGEKVDEERKRVKKVSKNKEQEIRYGEWLRLKEEEEV